MIIYGALRACTNQYFGGGGTTIATVNGAITLGMVRKIAKNLQANHGKPVNKVLKASANYGTDAVAEGFTVYCHTDLEPDIRDLPNFTPAEKYASGTPMPNEIGKCERFRFITSPDLPSSRTPARRWAPPVALDHRHEHRRLSVHRRRPGRLGPDRGARHGTPRPDLPAPGEKSKSDPHGQRGYAGTIWWKAVMIENQGWMAVGFVGSYLEGIAAVKDQRAVDFITTPIGDRMSSQPLNTAGLVIKTGGSTLAKTGATDFYAVANGILVKIAASTDMPALTGINITATKFNVVCFFVDSGGTVTAAAGTQGAALGNVVFPQFPKNKALVGFLIITYAGTFTGGTTPLDTATTVYVSPLGAFDATILTG
jgi:hypothetical protein